MEIKKIEELNAIADEFGSIAKKVNESSKKRQGHSVEIINLIKKSLEIGEALNEKLKKVAESNVMQRNQDNIAAAICKILNSNVDRQLRIIKEVKSHGMGGNEILDKVNQKIIDLNTSLNQALINSKEIIEFDNNIILMDNLIMMRKKYQQDSISTLKKLADLSLEDSERAIEGSSANLKRGLELVERFKKVETLLKGKNKTELDNLIEDARKGWNTAENVNKSSRSQLDFTEKVKKFTDQFHEDSVIIRDLVNEKHYVFESCLQVVTVLTVIISVKFKKYLEIRKFMEEIDYKDEIRNSINNLNILIDIACKDIEELTKLNYDMTDSSHLNNEMETKTVELTEKELEYFKSIRTEVEAMTEAASYPITGSGKNIINGQSMENMLRELVGVV